jgi:hypothetical protein
MRSPELKKMTYFVTETQKTAHNFFIEKLKGVLMAPNLPKVTTVGPFRALSFYKGPFI